MNEENTKKLFDEFPGLWKHKDNTRASLMGFGFEYDDGWFGLTRGLCERINGYFLEKQGGIPEYFYVTQCKEKFGGLRFYVSGAPKEIHDMIDEAEKKSYTICERCGKPGKLRDDMAWWLTLCDKHHAARLREAKNNLERAIRNAKQRCGKPKWAAQQVVRESGLVEDVCEHGVGHPNRDWLKRHDPGGKLGFSVHGCDGCCSPEMKKAFRKKQKEEGL